MTKTCWERSKLVGLGWLFIISILLGSHAGAQSATTQLTILVRDTSGKPLGGVHVLVIPDRQGAMPLSQTMQMGNRHQITDATGHAVWQELPQGNYVVQFDTMVTLADGRPMEPVTRQNRATDDTACSPLPGFCLRVAEVTAFTARFVIGGTAVADHTVPATPFWDLAGSDTAPVRPVSPILGKEITAAEAAQQGGTFQITVSPPSPAMRAQAQRARATHTHTLWWLVGGAILIEIVVACGLIWWGRAHPHADSSETAQ